MLKSKKMISMLLTMTLLFSCMFSAIAVYAEEEEEPELEESVQEPDSLEDTNLGGYKGLVAHWKFDGDLTDSSEFINDGEAVGGKTGITFTDAIWGKGVKLDGKSYIKVKNSASLRLSDEFTITFWVYKDEMRKKDAMEGGVPYLLKGYDEGSDYPYGLYEWNEMTPAIVYTDTDRSGEVTSQKQVDLQKWTLISATYDGETMKIYRDKEMVKSELTSTSFISSAQPLYIGFGNFMTVDNYFKGVMDDMKIYNTVLSYSDIEDLYDKAAAEASGKDLINKPDRMVAYYKFEDNLKDLSGFNNNGTAVKASNFKYVAGMAGKGIKFSGSSYIEVKDSDALDLDKGFTLGAWVYEEKSKNAQPLFAKYGASFNKNDCAYQLINSDYMPELYLADFEENGQIDGYYTDEAKEVADNKWYYYTATYDGKQEEDSTVKIYINGKLIGSEDFSGEISNSTGPLWIGGTTDSVYFKGILDELRVYNYALTPAEVKKLYGMKDGLEVVSAIDKSAISPIKSGKEVQLQVNLLTHTYTAPDKTSSAGSEELKRLNVTEKAVYKSDNEKVVKVSKDGKLTAVGKGKTTIKVTYGNYSMSTPIKVN